MRCLRKTSSKRGSDETLPTDNADFHHFSVANANHHGNHTTVWEVAKRDGNSGLLQNKLPGERNRLQMRRQHFLLVGIKRQQDEILIARCRWFLWRYDCGSNTGAGHAAYYPLSGRFTSVG